MSSRCWELPVVVLVYGKEGEKLVLDISPFLLLNILNPKCKIEL